MKRNQGKRGVISLFGVLVLVQICAIGSPASTEAVVVRMIDPVDSDVNKVGDTFRATLEEPLSVDRMFLPKGTPATVQLVHVKQSGQLRGQEEVALRLQSLQVEGRNLSLDTQLAELASEGKGGDTAKVVGGGAAAGAIVGAIVGGKKGAVIGAATGAGTGTVIQLARGKTVRISSESLLSFPVDAPSGVREVVGARVSPAPEDRPRGGSTYSEGLEEEESPDVFGPRQQRTIREWFSNRQNLKGLPPGLAKKKQQPPGLQRQLQRNGTLPPGLQKRLEPLPIGLERRLPPLPASFQRGIVGSDVVLLDGASRIVDILRSVLP